MGKIIGATTGATRRTVLNAGMKDTEKIFVLCQIQKKYLCYVNLEIELEQKR